MSLPNLDQPFPIQDDASNPSCALRSHLGGGAEEDHVDAENEPLQYAASRRVHFSNTSPIRCSAGRARVLLELTGVIAA